jgi:Ni,Fe-hydrogenase III large subunit
LHGRSSPYVEEVLAELYGNRFGRGFLTVGGVRLGLPGSELGGFVARLASAVSDFESIAEVIFDAPSVVSRFERTGAISQTVADDLGLVGPVARACGCDRDARRGHPEGIYRRLPVAVALRTDGDVMARAEVRRAEVGHPCRPITPNRARTSWSSHHSR